VTHPLLFLCHDLRSVVKSFVLFRVTTFDWGVKTLVLFCVMTFDDAASLTPTLNLDFQLQMFLVLLVMSCFALCAI